MRKITRCLCLVLLLAAASGQDEAGQKAVPAATKQSDGTVPAAAGGMDSLIDSDISVQGNCSFAAAQFCKGVTQGKQRILRCLTSALVGLWDGVISESSLGMKCVEEMIHLKLNLSKNINNDVYLRNACLNDAKSLCSDEEQNTGAIVACLRRKRKDTSKDCRSELFRIMREASFDFRLDASLQNACAHVVESSCSSVVPGEGRVLTCLHNAAFKKSGEQMDAGCKKEVVRQMRQNSGDIRLNFNLQSLCRTEIKTVCKGLKPGDDTILRCLVKHKSDKGFGPKCVSIVNETQRRQQIDLAQNKRLTSSCAEDLNTICELKESSLSEADLKEQRKYLLCLIKHRDGLEDECMEEVKILLAHQFEDIHSNPDLENACQDQIEKYCKKVLEDGGSVIDCLIENRKKGLGDTCKNELLHQRIVRNEDVRFHQPLLEACAQDITTFCAKVEPGQGRIMHCLSGHMQDDRMTSECRKRMDTLHHASAQDYRLNAALHKACALDAQEHCREECVTGDNITECDGKVVACLQNKATGNDAKVVSEDCRKELALLTGIQAQDYRNVEGVADACDADVQKFCINPEKGDPVAPGEGRIFKCLFAHFDELTDACKKEEMRFKIMTAGKIRDQPTILMMCQDELARHCKEVHPVQGSILRCLISSHRENPKDFGSDCFSVLKEMTQSSLKDFRFNLGVRKNCEGLLNELECTYEDEPLTPDLRMGKVLGCLVDNYDRLMSKGKDYAKCARELVGLVRMGIDFFRAGSPVTERCDKDVDEMCIQASVEPGTCLIQNFVTNSKSMSEACRKLMRIGFTDHSVDLHSEQLTQQMEDIKSQMQLFASKPPKTIEAKNTNDNQGIITAIVFVGGAVIVTVFVGVWLIRKYLNKGYVVLKSGSA